ncbi:MAG TPA: enoyl-CoA hydratase-related protein [Burkholderiaceae bacterium]|nr:enoyl-CoA hydratase-related protein [Burkholderiaceae bacterium]
MSDSGRILLDIADGIATITLDRAGKRNAMSPPMRREFGEHVTRVAADSSVRIVLLCANGETFCAGADLIDAPTEPMAWRERILLAQSQHAALTRMGKIVIACVQGAAVGGGAALALSADILVMATDACLVFPFVRIGLVPDAGTAYLLQEKLGAGAALDLLLTGGTLDSDEALRLGLTRRVVPAGELRATGRALAESLLALPHEGLVLTKSLCRQSWARAFDAALAHEADAFALASATPGHARAMQAMRARLTNSNPER